MSELRTLMESGLSIMDASERRLLTKMKAVEPKVFDDIMKFFENVDISNGKLSSSQKAQDFLMSLDTRIRNALKGAGYADEIAKFVKDFDKITVNTIKLHDQMNKVNLTASQLAPIQRVEVAATVENLIGSGMDKAFIQPVRQALYRSIQFGTSFTDAEQIVKNYVFSTRGEDSKLLRYVKQVSRDSIAQYDGSLQAKIANDLGLNARRYVGSLIQDSRAQCAKWVGMGIISNDDLQNEIDWAMNGGTFEIDGKTKKCSGMNPDTTVQTFDIYRGGYNCRHRSIPTYSSNK